MRRLAIGVLLALALPTSAAAQAGSCELDQPGSGTVTRTTDPSGFSVISVRQVVIRCEGGAEVRADEANIFQATRESHLFGNVVFQDSQRRLTSNTAIYNSAIGRLHATGDVVFTDLTTGSTLRGPNVEYYRAMPTRPDPQVIAIQRPHLTVAPEEQQGTPGQPLEVDGDRITIIGNNLSAFGSVVIYRPDLNATAGEAQYNRGTGRLDLRGNAQVKGEQYNLTGDEIEAILPAGGIEQLLARRNATLSGDQLQVQGPELQLFFANDQVQRLLARGLGAQTSSASRPVVTATGFRLEADSIEALSPGQRLDRVIAIGSARGEAIDTIPVAPVAAPSPPDSAAPAQIALDRDWIAGDTVIGFFVTADSAPAPAATPDSANTQIDRLVAKGSARSLYRVAREDRGPGAQRALNYLSGEGIELTFAAGELEAAEVTGLQRGVYLDPVPAAEMAAPAEQSEAAGLPAQSPAPPPGRRR